MTSLDDYLDDTLVQRNDEFFEWFMQEENFPGDFKIQVKVTSEKGKVIKHVLTSKVQRKLKASLHDAEVYAGIKYSARKRHEVNRAKRVNTLSPVTNDSD